VIIDMAAGKGLNTAGQIGGGNCALTVADQVTTQHGVQLVGYTNLPALVAADASALYARNLLDFMKLIVDAEGKFTLNLDDDIVAACLMCHAGELKRTS
jgi:NAD(P) transhydrogenase subunit alpha